MTLKANVKKGIRFIPNLVRYKERKKLFRIFRELIQLTIFHKAFPDHYFSRHLYRKEVLNIKDYLPNKFLYKASLALNDLDAATLLRNKLFFDLFYSQYIQNLPRVMMHNHGNVFMIGSERQLIDSPEKFESLVFDILQKKSTNQSVFIKKMYESYGGKNIFKLTEVSFPMEGERLIELYDNIIKNAYLFQDTIVQHADLDRLNPSCINTIRMDSFIDQEGKCELVSAFIRMSTSGSFVDNISSGGCYVGVDLETGELKEQGYSSITVGSGEIITSHPQTGIVFGGYKIPFFSEAKNLVLEVAGLIPKLRLIGWDIAITEKGPVLIEGNCGYDITANDMAYGGYRANPVFRKVLEELNYHK